MAVWNVTRCSPVEIQRRFGGTCSLTLLQGWWVSRLAELQGVTFQKMGILRHCCEDSAYSLLLACNSSAVKMEAVRSSVVPLRARAQQENWQPQRNRNFWELLLNVAAQIEETATQFPQYALHHAGICVQLRLITNNSRKLRLRCGFQFPWCALAQILTEYKIVTLQTTGLVIGTAVRNLYHFWLLCKNI
jgi:hypothetical protein